VDLAALGLAFLLGLRHALDPDHLVAVTSLAATERRGPGAATRLGLWWGLGHAATLIALGATLIALGAELPPWLEAGAETAVGVVIVALGAMVILKWVRGDYRGGGHSHDGAAHRHLRHGPGAEHSHGGRTPARAFAIGILHGLAGSGAVVLLLVAMMDTRLEAVLALAVFAPMSVVSMAGCTAVLAWVLTRPGIEPVYRRVVIPVMGGFALMFGTWYAGLG
jgi:hypothetical protein